MTLKERIITHLKNKGEYDENVDSDMIDDLIDNAEMAKKCMKELKTQGVLVTRTFADGTEVTKMNPLVNIYQMFLRNANQICGKLGINRSDRLRLKIIEKKTADALDQILKS